MSETRGVRVIALDAGVWTVAAVQRELAALLTAGNVAEAAAEARDLMAVILDRPRFWPTLHPHEAVAPRIRDRMRDAARRRAAGMPFAYAAGRAAFRHLTLAVDERVLIPRQETEQLVQEVLDRTAAVAGGVAVDVGTGSGAIALALATEGRFDHVIATDVSLGALRMAEENARLVNARLRCGVELRHGSLLAPVLGVSARVVVSNPPYIAYHEAVTLPRAVRNWEPTVALFSAGDGMAATREIIAGAAALLEEGGLLALELDARRASLAAEAAAADGRYSDVTVRLDLAGRDRILLATRT